MPGNNCAGFGVNRVMTHLQIGICSHTLCHVICPLPGCVDKVSWTKAEYFPTNIKFSLAREMYSYETMILMVA
jgi:hypothetical protein